MMLSEQPSHFDVSPWLLQSDKEKMTVTLGQDYGEWLLTGNAVKEEDNYQTWLTAGTNTSQPTITNWLHQGDHSNEQWLLPRG